MNKQMACPLCPNGYETIWIEWNDTVVRRCTPIPEEIQAQILSFQITGIGLIAFFLLILCMARIRPSYRRRIVSNGTVHLEEV